jgi:hypothetical protein
MVPTVTPEFYAFFSLSLHSTLPLPNFKFFLTAYALQHKRKLIFVSQRIT